MNRIALIEYGYFAKELPPCFTTKKFAAEFDTIMQEFENKHNGYLNKLLAATRKNKALTTKQKSEEEARIKTDFRHKLAYSACVTYSIPKVGLSRKEIKIPNPLQQGRLVQNIERFYPEIAKLYTVSALSVTRPVENMEPTKVKRAITHLSFTEFREKCILSTYYMPVQLKTDISKFYHSIYTHSVPWATEGKPQYKKNRALNETDPRKKKNIYGDTLDQNLSNCQSQQTKGIPIGPDTSLMIAEIICCHIDSLLQADLKKKAIDFVGFRYVDDYYLYFNSPMEAEIALDILGKTLADFELETNHEKTIIQSNPFSIEHEWVIDFKSYFFRSHPEGQKEDIWNYFALAFQNSKKYPHDSVLNFALNKFLYVRIEKENWDMFEPLLLRVGLVETSTLQTIARILLTYRSLVSKKRIKNFAYELIKQHYQKNHDYELTWALWLLKQFDIPVRKDIFELIFQTNSVTAILIGLDLLQKKKGNINIQPVLEKVTDENLVTPYWLLAYEAAVKGWSGISPILIEKSCFFGILKAKSISFYDPTETLEPIKVEKSLLKKVARKLTQVEKALKSVKASEKQIIKSVESILRLLSIDKRRLKAKNIQDNLSKSDQKIAKLLQQLIHMQEKQDKFADRRIFFILEKRLEELHELTQKELALQSQDDSNLLFDPTYT